MTSSANNRGFSRMGVDPTVSGLVDGTDFPHSALFHALNIATQGNYAIIEGNNFDITQSDSSGKTQFSVAAGRVVRNGALQAAVSTANFTQGSPAAFEEPTSGFSYYLLVVNSSNALELKNNGGTIITDTVPNPANTDIPIAVLRLGAGETTTQRHVQFLTTTKTSNSLSIARDDSGVYTESASIQSNAGDIEIEALEEDKDIIFKVNDGGSTTDRLILYGDNDPSYPNTEVKIEGSLLTTEDIQANKLVIGYGNTPSSGVAEIGSYSSSEDMVFKTGSSVERIRITNGGNVGIGTSSPSETLHVSGNVLIEDPSSTGSSDHLLEVKSGSSGTPDNARIIISADTDLKLPMLHIRDTEANSGTFNANHSAYIALDRASAIVTGSAQNDLLIANGNYNKDIHLCTNPTSDGSGVQAQMTIAANGNVGIGTSSPTEKLHLSDGDGTEPTILIENTGTNASEPELVFMRSTATGADSRDIGNIRFKARDTAGNYHTYCQILCDQIDADTTTEDGRLVFSLTQAGTDFVEFLTMGNLESVFNGAGNDINFRVEGDSEANLLFVDAGNNKVGIGTNSPSEVFSVQGNIRSSGNVIVGGDLDHDGSNIGFFGTAVASQQTVSNILASPITPSNEPTAAELASTSTAISNLETKLNDILDALRLYGLIS